MEVRSPEIIGRYELMTRLATGGMAEVFLARERGMAGLERLVVIKRILPHLADDKDFREMFAREARIIARLAHPNIVQYYELGETEGRYYIALEYIHGTTVRELQILANKRRMEFDLRVALGITLQAARGLHAAHELRDSLGQPLGLVHRDVTPHNLMCTDQGNIKLLDFGIAKATEGGSEATFSGDLKGKFSYMSPEQVLQHPLDRRSDVFALGIVLWEMCTGRRLFKRASQLEIMQAITKGGLPPLRTYREGVPGGLDAILARALSRDKNQRYATAQDFALALRDLAASHELIIDSTTVASFVRAIAGETLQRRHAAVKTAFDAVEEHRTQMLRTTGDLVLQHLEDDKEMPTVVERPSGPHNPLRTSESGRYVPDDSARRVDSGSFPSAAGGHPELIISDDDPTTVSQTSTKTRTEHKIKPRDQTTVPFTDEPPERPAANPGATMFLAAAVTVGIGVTGFLAYRTMTASESADAGAVAVESADAGPDASEDAQGGPVFEGPAIKIGWAPILDAEVLVLETERLHDYISVQFERPVQLVLASSYEDLGNKIVSGEVDYAVMPPLLYVRTIEREDAVGLEMLANKLYDGVATSDGHLYVRTADDITSVRKLKGKTFCLTDENSTTGNFLLRSFLRKKRKNPDRFMGEVVWSGNHLQAVKDLIDGKCQAAATHSGTLRTADREGLLVGSLRLLDITGHVPQDAFVAGRHISAEDREAMRQALVGLDPMKEVGKPRLGDKLRISGFQPGDETLFEDLRLAVKKQK